MKSNYDIRALADTTGNVLWSKFGEVLRLLDSNDTSLKYLNDVLRRPQMEVCFRLFVLNQDETINYEIPQSDIILDSGNYTENYQSGQRKNLNIELVNIDGQYTPSINTLWVHNKFRFDVGIKFYEKIQWFPRGIYVLNNPSVTHSLSEKTISLSLVDKFAILEGKPGTLEGTYEIPVDSDIKQAIVGILTLDNGTGYPLDLKPIIYDANLEGIKMPYTLTKDAGSTLGEMLLEIGTILNAEIYYNSQGNLCVMGINETCLDIRKAVLWDYTDKEREYAGATINYDFENAINEVHIVGDNINNEIFSAMTKNNNPLSPLCIQRIGRRIEYINDTNIYSDDLAQQRAAYELRKLSVLKTIVDVQVAFNPLLFVNNLITLTDDYYGFNRQKYLIQSISYSIGTQNSMTISCSDIENFSNLENEVL